MGNKQAQLLQEVKEVLERTYPRTSIRSDRNVVLVPFDSYAVEVVPGFETADGKYLVPDSSGGGKYTTSDYLAEAQAIAASDNAYNGNTRHLVRMMKCWQGYCSVPAKSFWLEVLATDFIAQWVYKGKGTVYYDWMVRDFLAYLKSKRNSFIISPGVYNIIWLGEAWFSRAETAYDRALKAIEHDAADRPYSGSGEWQKIFGADFPSPSAL